MILVIEHIEKIPVERMDVLYFGEIIEDVDETLADGLMAKFDLSGGRDTLRM
jgi:hypothetical protein